MVSHVAHPARRAQINKLLWRIWASIASQFREPEDAYEGQLSIEKNAIWGCVGLVGRCPVVSAPLKKGRGLSSARTFNTIHLMQFQQSFLRCFSKFVYLLHKATIEKYHGLDHLQIDICETDQPQYLYS